MGQVVEHLPSKHKVKSKKQTETACSKSGDGMSVSGFLLMPSTYPHSLLVSQAT
jgi:hypothetical protein